MGAPAKNASEVFRAFVRKKGLRNPPERGSFITGTFATPRIASILLWMRADRYSQPFLRLMALSGRRGPGIFPAPSPRQGYFSVNARPVATVWSCDACMTSTRKFLPVAFDMPAT
jgi:hypothetical protein